MVQLSLKRSALLANVGPEDEIREGDTVVVIGKKELIDKLDEMNFF